MRRHTAEESGDLDALTPGLGCPRIGGKYQNKTRCRQEKCEHGMEAGRPFKVRVRMVRGLV